MIYVMRPVRLLGGDYSDVLLGGDGEIDDDDVLHLRRSGPWVPPLAEAGFTGEWVVTEQFKREFADAGLTGPTFVPVVLDKAVRIDWFEPSTFGEQPRDLPESGEPNGYLDEEAHDDEVAAAIGTLWHMALPTTAVTGREGPIVRGVEDLWIERDTLGPEDLFRAEGAGYAFVTQRAMAWIQDRARDVVEFTEIGVR